MSNDEEDDKLYEVGYGKPPKHSQWPKGVSGNPSGKKKKEDTLLDQLKKLSGKEIVVHQNGVPVTMTQGEAMLAALFAKAMKADLGSIKFICQTLGISEADLAAAKSPAFTEGMLNVLETHADWMAIVETAHAELAEDSDEINEGGDDDATF